MEYLGIAIGIIASTYELYTKFLPWTRKSFPDTFKCYLDTNRYKPIMETIKHSQFLPQNARWGARTIMGVYQDMKLMLESPAYRVGCGCKCLSNETRPINLVEFYWLIRNSPDWQPDIHAEITPQKREEHIEFANRMQPGISEKDRNMVIEYYWYLQELHEIPH